MIKERQSSSRKRPEILIAEDSLTQATQIKHLLESFNYKVSVAKNGKQAMDLLTKHKPSLIISDILMPEMNGYELCKKIKSNKNTEDIPVILLTRLYDPEEIIEGLSCGADSFITKPYNEKHLLSNIEKLLCAEKIVDYQKVPFGVQILFNGEKRFIQSEQQNVINLMLDIYEGAIHQNEKLIQTQEKLRLLNEQLELIVEERTSDLREEMNLSNQIADRLKESEEKFRKLFEDHSAVKLLIDPDSGEIIDANKSAADYYGWSRKELKGMKIDQINTLTSDEVKKEMEKVVSQKRIHFEFRHRRNDGSIRDVDVFSSIIKVGNKNVLHSIIHDITERKQAELALRISEEKYRTIFENIQDVYYETSIDGTILSLSPSISLMSKGQYQQDDLVGKSMYDFYSDPEERKLIIAALKEKGAFPDFEIRLKNRDGSSVPCSISAKISFDAQGYPEKIIGSMRDISRRKLAEVATDNERRMLRTLIDNIPDMIYIKDLECRKVIANIEDVKNIGYEKEEEVLGKTDMELFPGKIGQRGFADDKKVIDSGNAIIDREEDFFDSKGVQRWLLTSKVPLRDKDGKIAGLVGISHDITKRKKVNEELVKAKEKAEESDRLKTAFLHNISHEIRTPMNAIVGFSTLLGEPDIDVQTQQSYIETIIQSSNHFLSIITDIIDISNIEANIIKINRNGINVNFTLNSVCNHFLHKSGEKKIELIYETGLSDSEALIITDDIKLTQVLTNLISNAFKFTNHGIIKVGCEQRDKFLEFRVSDTGIGIPEEFHQKIFERFYQVQNTVSRLYEGTGLGLAISKAYVDLMGGKIWLSSEPGKGTTFYFTIPYEKQTIASLSIDEEPLSEALVLPEKKTILVAEDIESNFKLVTWFLSGTNIKLMRASNGKEAIEKFLQNPDIDLILMDIKMPVMDGLEATRQIKIINPNVPVIAITAYAMAGDEARITEAGCDYYLTKPIDKKLLFEKIAEYIML